MASTSDHGAAIRDELDKIKQWYMIDGNTAKDTQAKLEQSSPDFPRMKLKEFQKHLGRLGLRKNFQRGEGVLIHDVLRERNGKPTLVSLGDHSIPLEKVMRRTRRDKKYSEAQPHQTAVMPHGPVTLRHPPIIPRHRIRIRTPSPPASASSRSDSLEEFLDCEYMGLVEDQGEDLGFDDGLVRLFESRDYLERLFITKKLPWGQFENLLSSMVFSRAYQELESSQTRDFLPAIYFQIQSDAQLANQLLPRYIQPAVSGSDGVIFRFPLTEIHSRTILQEALVYKRSPGHKKELLPFVARSIFQLSNCMIVHHPNDYNHILRLVFDRVLEPVIAGILAIDCPTTQAAWGELVRISCQAKNLDVFQLLISHNERFHGGKWIATNLHTIYGYAWELQCSETLRQILDGKFGGASELGQHLLEELMEHHPGFASGGVICGLLRLFRNGTLPMPPEVEAACLLVYLFTSLCGDVYKYEGCDCQTWPKAEGNVWHCQEQLLDDLLSMIVDEGAFRIEAAELQRRVLLQLGCHPDPRFFDHLHGHYMLQSQFPRMRGPWPTLKGTLEASEGGVNALLEYLESCLFSTELCQELLLHTTLMRLTRDMPQTPLVALEAVLAAKLKKGFFVDDVEDCVFHDGSPFYRLLLPWRPPGNQSRCGLGYNYVRDTGIAEEAIASLARDRDTGSRNFPYFCKLIDLWAKYQLPINYTRAIERSITNYSTHHLRYLINTLKPNIADLGSEAFLRAAVLDPPSVGAFDAMRLLVDAGLDVNSHREEYRTSLLVWALSRSVTECNFDTADRTHFLLGLATIQGETIPTSTVHTIATFIFAPRERNMVAISKFESLFTILKILEQYGLDIRSLSEEISLWWFFKIAHSAPPIVEEAFRFLLSRGVPLTTFALSVMIYCRAGNTFMDQILSARVAVDFTKEEVEANPWIEYTPLQSAVLFGDLALVKRLVRLNANVNALLPTKTYIGGKCTALGIACMMSGQEPNILETIRYLISKGAEVNTGIQGVTEPLQATAISGNLEAASLLLVHGASVTQRVLETAAMLGRLDMISLLLEKGGAHNVTESVLDIHKVIRWAENWHWNRDSRDSGATRGAVLELLRRHGERSRDLQEQRIKGT